MDQFENEPVILLENLNFLISELMDNVFQAHLKETTIPKNLNTQDRMIERQKILDDIKPIVFKLLRIEDYMSKCFGDKIVWKIVLDFKKEFWEDFLNKA